MGDSAIQGVPALGGGAGAVTSVATRTGDVVLTAADVGAGTFPGNVSFGGTVTLPSGIIIPSSAVLTTQAALDNSTKAASTAYADAAVAVEASRASTAEALLAPKASPALTGHPTGVTESAQDSSTRLASTAYVDRAAFMHQEMKQRGFLAWNGPSHQTVAGAVLVSQSLYVIRIPVLETISVTNICVIVGTLGATLTTGQNLATLYNQAGTKQGDTADQTTVWTSTGYYVMAVSGGPYSITGGPTSYCWVSILSNGTTPATFNRNSSNINGVNAGASGLLTGANIWAGRNGTAVTATATITPSSNVQTGAIDIWVGLS